MNIFMKVGNLLGTPKQKKPLTINDLEIKVGEYRTINEGDPEMVEDPEFPLQMMQEALDNNNTIEGSVVQGTYVYYPNKRKPKMWIGNYKILNPEDILCKKIAAKIGLSEEEWKKTIEMKRRGYDINKNNKNNTISDGSEYNHISNIIDQKDTIKNIIENSNLQYEYNTEYINDYNYMDSFANNINDNMNNIYHLGEQSHIANSYEFDNYSNEQSINNNNNNDRSYYPNDTTYTNDMYDNAAYVQRLNKEIELITEEQAKLIQKQRDDILSYSNSQGNPIFNIHETAIENEQPIEYQMEEPEYVDANVDVNVDVDVDADVEAEEVNYEIKKAVKKTPEKKESTLKNKNSNIKKSVYAQDTYMKKNNNNSSSSSSSNKNSNSKSNNKEYANLSQMSTKTSLGTTEKVNTKKYRPILKGTKNKIVH